jgi:hypothetical protein
VIRVRVLGWLFAYIVALAVLTQVVGADDTWDVIALAFGMSIAAVIFELVLERRRAHRSQFEEYRRRARKREKPPE